MQMEATDAFDINREPKHIREMYGDSVQARQILIARRLIERGVRYVQLWHGGVSLGIATTRSKRITNGSQVNVLKRWGHC